MDEFILSWNGGHCKSPTWNNVKNKIEELSSNSGVVTLESRQRHLQVRAEPGCYLMTLGEMDNLDDWTVRTYSNNLNKSGMVVICGDLWPAKQVCYEHSLVLMVFQEFFNTCNVPNSILD